MKRELELNMIEKMSNDEVSLYFKEINEFYKNKNVNYRLNKIIKNNANNILRVHKKLNSLKGGLKKFTGGSIIPKNDPNPAYLLLNEYNDLSAKEVTSNINDLAYHKNFIYVVGNSGYFSKYDLETKQWTSPNITNDKHTNLNNIFVNDDEICIVGDEGTVIYSSDKTTFNYKTLKNGTTDIINNLLEVFIDSSNIYIVGENILFMTAKNTIKDFEPINISDSLLSIEQKIESGSTFFNIFKNATTAYNILFEKKY